MSDKHETNWLLRFIDDITQPLKKPQEASRQLAVSVESVTASVDQMDTSTVTAAKGASRSFDKIKRDVKSTEAAVDDLEDEVDDLGDTFRGLESDMKDVGAATTVTSGEVDGFFDMLGGVAFGSIAGGLASVKTGIQGITKAGLTFIATPIGAAIAALVSIALVADAFVDYNKAAYEANEITQQITKTSGDLLDQNRLRAKAMEETFGKDFTDTLTIARNNVKAFDITYQEAFDAMENGLIRGGKANDEFLDSLREYPKLFAENGFSIQEFQRIVNTGIDEGVYSDKLPDAIKEFGLSITEQTKASRDALEGAFGKKFTDKLFKDVTSGLKSPKEALQAISAETQRVGVNSKQAQTLTADLFRGAGEDAGGFLEIIRLTNQALNEEEAALTDIEGFLKQVADANLELAEAKDKAMNSDALIETMGTLELFWKEVQIVFYKALEFVVNFSDQSTKWIAKFIIKTAAVANELPRIFKDQFNNIKEEVIDVVKSLGGIGDIMAKLVDFDFSGAYDSAKKFGKDLKKEISDVGAASDDWVDDIKDVWDRADRVVQDNFDKRTKAIVGSQKEIDTRGSGNNEPGGDLNPGGGKNNPFGGTSETSGSGRGGNAITMTLEVTNNFNVQNGQDIMDRKDEIIDMVVSSINSRVKDGLIAATA